MQNDDILDTHINSQDLRAFLDCHEKWHECKELNGATILYQESMSLCSRKKEEFMADFERLCWKHAEPHEVRQLLAYFHIPMRLRHVAAKIGKVLRTIQPYALWPPRAYFNVPIQMSNQGYRQPAPEVCTEYDPGKVRIGIRGGMRQFNVNVSRFTSEYVPVLQPPAS